jgi:hypothetical protein
MALESTQPLIEITARGVSSTSCNPQDLSRLPLPEWIHSRSVRSEGQIHVTQGSCVAFHGCIIVRSPVTFVTQTLRHMPGAYCVVCVAAVFVNGAQKRAGLEMVMTSREVMYVF